MFYYAKAVNGVPSANLFRHGGEDIGMYDLYCPPLASNPRAELFAAV